MQSNDSNIDDEIVETHSFTNDSGGLEYSVIACVCLFSCVLVWKMTKTQADIAFDDSHIDWVWVKWNSNIDDETMKRSDVTISKRMLSC